MIFDQIENAHLYFPLGEKIRQGLSYLIETDFSKISKGKYPIDGDDVFALVDQYNSKPLSAGKWEAHKRYIDIQYVINGVENIGFGKIKDMKIIEEYNTEKDIMFLEGKGNFVKVKEGHFVILFPDDIHMPGISVDDPATVKKVVIKVKF
ncbi:YhcH/YjgK/YiaL family protein [Melioribacteraceae bacterium 4301-Me]|uniref:YhcH/YjgK/YiaL family protein n=1 Tax=Pyranulibacter aquaticus TaxID=3163344 RepID=UPI00359683FA